MYTRGWNEILSCSHSIGKQLLHILILSVQVLWYVTTFLFKINLCLSWLGNFVECNGVAFNFAEQIGYSSTFLKLVFQLLATVNKHHSQCNLNEGN